MALATVTTLRPAHGDPGDILTTAAPVIGADQPKAADIRDGDASVATQTGAMQYSYPIRVPPGRHGMEPHLSLNYSSQAPIYGGIAAGWSLSIPEIREDTSKGRLRRQTVGAAINYVSSMAGGRPLLLEENPEPTSGIATYRAQNDSSFARYQRMDPIQYPFTHWTVLTPDGMTYLFGDPRFANCPNISDGNAPLTHMIDEFNNQIDYYWTATPGNTTYQANDCHIDHIDYGAGTGLSKFATVSFAYDSPAASTPCGGIPVGSAIDYRQEFPHVVGSRKLSSVVVTAYEPGTTTVVHTRQISLTYDSATESCNASYSAYRQLDSIQESAWGTNSPRVDLPPVTLTYGSAIRGAYQTASSSIPWSVIPQAPIFANLAWGYRFDDVHNTWPSVEAMMLDIDGDGLPDRVTNTSHYDAATSKYVCEATWERNTINSAYVTGTTTSPPTTWKIRLPTLKWGEVAPPTYAGAASPNTNNFNFKERCALNYQLTGYANSHDPDAEGPGLCSLSSPNCPSAGVCANGNDCAQGVPFSGGPTYLSYRWIDVDGDGLVDLIASPAGSAALKVYNLQMGNGLGGYLQDVPERPFGVDFPACPSTPFTALPNNWGSYTMCHGMYPWMIYKNLGNGQFATTPTIKYAPVPLESDLGDSSITSSVIGQYQGMFDIDGDGIPDIVFSDPTSPSVIWVPVHGVESGSLRLRVGDRLRTIDVI